ncbi:hypothetical protein RSAG8_13887, partial [Rhizoctonia solani AG-8 WAC10335]
MPTRFTMLIHQVVWKAWLQYYCVRMTRVTFLATTPTRHCRIFSSWGKD